MSNTFSVKDGIDIQTRDLAMWEKLLKPEVFEKIRLWTVNSNPLAITGFDVCRGNAILNLIVNYDNINR